MRQIDDARFAPAARLAGSRHQVHDGFTAVPPGCSANNASARGVEDETQPGRSHRKIDNRDWSETGSKRKRFQGRPDTSCSLCSVLRRRQALRADHPEIPPPVVNLDRGDVAKSRGGGTHEIHGMIRALSDDEQLAPEPIANEESTRDGIVGEPAEGKARGREPGVVRSQTRGWRG